MKIKLYHNTDIRPWPVFALFGVVVALVYGKAISFNFVVWDDPSYLTMNPDVWKFGFQQVYEVVRNYYNGNYHPVTMVAFMLEYQVFGLEPFGYHFINVVLHFVNICLLYIFIKQFNLSDKIAMFCCVVWALHPQRVEVVGWIVGLKDLLATLFSIMFIVVYKYLSEYKANIKLSFLAVLLFALACLSKGTSVVLLVYPLMIYFYPTGDFKKRNVYIILCFFVITALTVCHNYLARIEFQGVLAEANTGVLHGFMQGIYRIGMYFIAMALIPFHLEVVPYLPGAYQKYIYFMCGLGVVFAFVVFTYYQGKNDRRILICAVCCLAGFLPSAFLPVVGYTMDRFSYYPTIWLALLAALLIEKYMARYNNLQRVLVPVIAIYIVIMGAVSFSRLNTWRDTVSLWEDAISLYEDKAGQQQNLAWAYSNLGWYYRMMGKSEEAISPLTKAVEIDGYTTFYRLNLAEAMINVDQLQGAADQIKKAGELEPGNLYIYKLMSRMAAKNNEIQKLLDELMANVPSEQKDYRFYYYVGCLELSNYNYKLSLEYLERARLLAPDSIDVYLAKAEASYLMKEYSRALVELEHARKIQGEHPEYKEKYIKYKYGINEMDIYN